VSKYGRLRYTNSLEATLPDTSVRRNGVALVNVSQPFGIQAETAQNRGVQIVYVDFVLNDVEADVVRFAGNLPSVDSAARHPHGESQRMMVTAFDSPASRYGHRPCACGRIRLLR